jgi:N-acetylglucosaminyldiphosphoundecaprenol N-acetyl-beta-D-mannosaminyltransferase
MMELRSPDNQGSHPKKENILGVQVSVINMDQALRTVDAWILERDSHYVTVTPAHSIMDAYQDHALRRIINASGMSTPDGMSIVWLLKLRGYSHVERVYGPDLLLEACRFGLSLGWRHFFYGGEAGVAAALASKQADQYPGLRIAGTYTPPFRPLTEVEDQEVLRLINDSGADIVWVGLGSPKQEYWMAEHLGQLHAPVMVGVGAAFDFLSGSKPQAPKWVQRSGLEWLFRFFTEPRRLWPRYRQYPKFVLLVAAQLLGLKSYAE